MRQFNGSIVGRFLIIHRILNVFENKQGIIKILF